MRGWMAMEEQWYADRCRLRELLRAHPDWTKRQLAVQLGRSLSWIKKWRRLCWPFTPSGVIFWQFGRRGAGN
jgi:hypothetical protein